MKVALRLGACGDLKNEHQPLLRRRDGIAGVSKGTVIQVSELTGLGR